MERVAGSPPDSAGPDQHDDPESEVPTRDLAGLPALLATLLAAGLSSYALYWVVGIVQPQIYRASFLLIALTLTFLLYPPPLAGADASPRRTGA